MKIRPYQTEAIQNLRRSFLAGKRRVILQATTGSGKTVIACEVIKSAVAKGKSVLFLAHRRELVGQCSGKLEAFGVEHGIIMAGVEDELIHRVQVASIQTLIRRLRKDPDWWRRHADLIITDECHTSLSATFKEVFELYPASLLIGLTATPCRGDGRGLGEVYQDMVQAISIQDLIDQNFLVPMVYFAPSKPDLEKFKVVRGEYDQKQVDNTMNKPKLIGEVVGQWKKLAADRRTIVFASSVLHSKALMHKFCLNAINAAHIDANTPLEERQDLLGKFRDGRIQVMCNCQILTEGFDLPEVSCIVLARPTKSFGLYLQMVGRGMRTAADKKDCVLIDHAGCVYDHGYVDEPVEWDLDSEGTAAKKKKAKDREKKPIQCPECSRLFCGSLTCPACGWKARGVGKDVLYLPGDLVEAVPKGRKPTMEEKKRFFAMLESYRRSRGYQSGWAAHKYREKFGVWPRGVDEEPPVLPDPAFMAWIKQQNAKGKNATDNR